MPRSPLLHDAVRAAILAHAAAVLAERGETARLSDIAVAAGVARSTLYRYFPNRHALLDALAAAALDELVRGIGEAGLDTQPVREALSRVTRGFIETGSTYIALASLRPKPDDSDVSRINGPLLLFFERGMREGTFRNDLAPTTLLLLYSDLIQGALSRASRARVDPVEESRRLVDFFLNGARAPEGRPRRQQ